MSEVKQFKDVSGKTIRFRNFSGKPGKYNAEGDRNFCLLIDPETADELQAEGFAVRFLNPRDENEDPVPYISVKVAYGKGRPPKIVMITKKGKTELDEESVSLLDWAEINVAHISINPYEWSVGGKAGVKAYLKTMYVEIQEDEFEEMYYDIPDSAKDNVGRDVD